MRHFEEEKGGVQIACLVSKTLLSGIKNGSADGWSQWGWFLKTAVACSDIVLHVWHLVYRIYHPRT
jgi:hypothetical protein